MNSSQKKRKHFSLEEITLPIEIYFEIFSFIRDKKTLNSISLCNKFFRSLLLSRARNILIKITNEINFSNFDLNFLKGCNNLDSLEILNLSEKSQISFSNVPSFQTLKTLILDRVDSFDFSKIRNLKNLDIKGILIFKNFPICENFRHLNKLSISTTFFSPDIKRCFPNLKVINTFTFKLKNGMFRIGLDRNLCEFLCEKEIENLIISNPIIIESEKVIFKNLQRLTILHNESCIPINFIQNQKETLKELTFQANNIFHCPQIFFHPNYFLKNLSKLVLFDFEKIYSPNCRTFFQNMNHLTFLSLENIEGIEIQDSIKHLCLLEFFHTGNSNTFSIGCFQNFQNLKTFIIGNCNFTNQFFQPENSNFQKLESLEFTKNMIQEKQEKIDFNILSNMQNLKILNLANKKNFGDFHQIINQCEKLEKIVWGEYCSLIRLSDFEKIKNIRLTHSFIDHKESRIFQHSMRMSLPLLIELKLSQNNNNLLNQTFFI